MNPTKAFRLILGLSLLFAFIGVFFDIHYRRHLPSPIQEFLHNQNAKPSDSPLIKTISFIGTLVFLFAVIAAYVGLFCWKKWARNLYLIITVFAYLIIFSTHVYIYPSAGYFFGSLSTLLSGLMLGLTYYPPIAQKFNPPLYPDKTIS